MAKPQEQSEFLGGRAEIVLREWQSVLDETDRPLDPSVLSNYSELVKCYSELNSHVERRRQDIVNCEGYAQNIIARGETLLEKFHQRAMTELDSAKGRVLALEKDKAALITTVDAQARDLNTMRVQIQGLQAKVKSHRTSTIEHHALQADIEFQRERNIKLDSVLEDLREDNDRLTRENNLLSAGMTWGEKAEVTAQAEAAQLTPPPPGVVAQTAPAQLPRQTDRQETVAGPSQPSINMDTVTQAMLPLLQDNISQMVTAAVRAQAGESAAADKAHIAQLQLQIEQLSKHTLVPPSSTGGHLPPQGMRLVAKAMQGSPAELEQLRSLPAGPLGQSEAQASASLAGSGNSDGTGGFEPVSHGTPTYVRGITHHDTNRVVALFDTGTVVAAVVDSPTTSVNEPSDVTVMETETESDAHTVSDT